MNRSHEKHLNGTSRTTQLSSVRGLPRRQLVGGAALTTLLLICCGTTVAADDVRALSVEQHGQLAQLGAPNYRDRLAAEKALLTGLSEHPEASILVLKDALRSPDLETRLRALRSVEGAYPRLSGDILDDVDDLLDLLVSSEGGSLGQRAFLIVDRHRDRRHARAVERLDELGAIVKIDMALARNSRLIGPPGGAMSNHVMLGQQWKGGDKGLRYLRRLLTSDSTIYYSTTAGLSEEAVQKLTLDLPPSMKVVPRGDGFLGVSGGVIVDDGLRIATVTENGPAAKGGILAGDVMIRFDDRPIANFDALIAVITEHLPGDKIPVVLLRGTQQIETVVELGTWAK